MRVVIHADTLLEVDGHSTIPPLFGVMYAAAMIPAITSFSLSSSVAVDRRYRAMLRVPSSGFVSLVTTTWIL